PRNVQHPYCGLLPTASSIDATGTYSRPPCSVGAPVIRASGCGSTCTVQSPLPVSASTAYAFAAMSPKNTAYRASPRATGPTLIAVRPPAFASCDQYTQPEAASSAYTTPVSDPT